jgi:hypothetical protein
MDEAWTAEEFVAALLYLEAEGFIKAEINPATGEELWFVVGEAEFIRCLLNDSRMAWMSPARVIEV